MSTSSTSYQPIFATNLAPSLAQPDVPDWKAELNAKLAAHRQRRPLAAASEEPGSVANARLETAQRAGEGSARASLVAARVAERYAKAPSYSEFLAASAAAAAAAAETAAFAARQAQSAAEALARLTAAGDLLDEEARQSDLALVAEPAPGVAVVETRRWASVEHPEPLPARGVVPPRTMGAPSMGNGIVDAFAEATVPAAVSLPAKLIEFPRELVAARKSRPRIAEGPLVEASLFDESADASASLRIFEVEDVAGVEMSLMATDRSSREEAEGRAAGMRAQTAQVTAQVTASRDEASSAALEGQRAPEWQSIRLGEHPAAESLASLGEHPAPSPGHVAEQAAKPVLHTASAADRVMAALVDVAVVVGGFLLFVFVFASCTAHPPVNRGAFVCAAVVFAGLFLFYEWLFMSYGGGTLGMRYAQIAVCTFEDDNPTRKGMRRRVGASVLSLLPLGLGFLWALFDEDGLGWHDRMTRSYQRSYR